MLRQATTQRFGVRVSYFEYQPISSFSLRAGDKLGYPNPRRRVFTTARNRNGKCSSISCHYSSVPVENHNQSIGTLCKVPRKRVELIKLARLDKPIGSILLFVPCAWPILLNASLVPVSTTLYHLTLFGVGSVLLRGAGCIINDLWDRDIDKLVERTKNRPLAKGTITTHEALLFLGGHLALGLGILLQLNTTTILLGVSSLALVVTYPLMKRITGWPQAFLGLTFNYGVLMASCASSAIGMVDWNTALPLYIAGISWTLVYDTIYALQDKKDDLKSGQVQSTAITFGQNLKKYIVFFASTSLGGFTAAGVMASLGLPYYAIAVGGNILQYSWMIWKLDPLDTTDCGKWFKKSWRIGGLVCLGIVVDFLFRYD